MSILAARWLTPVEYGAFAVGYSMFLFLAALYTAVLLEPMAVFGAGMYARKLPRYFGALLYVHAAICVLLSVILALSALAVGAAGSAPLAWALSGLAAALPFLLLFWLVRRGFYVDIRPHLALGASAGFCAAVICVLAAVRYAGLLAPSAIFIVLGFASLAASSAFLPVLRPDLRVNRAGLSIPTVMREHWKYGSWNALATGFYWASGQVVVVLLPAFLGLGASATFAAVSNLFRPLNLVMQSVTLLLLPTLSSQAGRDSRPGVLVSKARLLVLFFTGATLLYCLLVSIFSGFIMHHLYAGKYDGAGFLVVLFALASTASVGVQILTTVLKAHRNTRSIVSVWIVSTVIVIVMVIPAMRIWGLPGAVGTVAASYLVSAAAAWIRLRRAEELPMRGKG